MVRGGPRAYLTVSKISLLSSDGLLVSSVSFTPRFCLCLLHPTMLSSAAFSAILDEPTAVKFVPGTDRADFGAIDLASNPQKTPNGFSWFLPNRATEATVTFVGRVAYDVIGDKTDEYFSLPGEQWVRTAVTLSPVFPTSLMCFSSYLS